MPTLPKRSEPPSETNPTGYFWDSWTPNARWRDNLARRGAHKALGIDDMGDINADNSTKTGVGWKELGALGATAVALAALYFWTQPPETAPPPPEPAPAAAYEYPGPTDTEYEVRFYDADGDLIDVPHISQRTTNGTP